MRVQSISGSPKAVRPNQPLAPLDVTLQRVADHLAQGYRRIKLKVKPGHDLGLLRAVRAEVPLAHLTVDANCCYTLADTALLQRMDDFDLDYIEQPLATQLACNPQQQDPRLQSMTQRELEIFVMLAKGTPARQIAEQLSISSKTVSNHLTLLKSKLQVSSHAELVHLGIDLGVVRKAG